MCASLDVSHTHTQCLVAMGGSALIGESGAAGLGGATSPQEEAHQATTTHAARPHGGEQRSDSQSDPLSESTSGESRSESESVERARRLLRTAAEYRRMEPCLLCDLTIHVNHPTSELLSPSGPANCVLRLTLPPALLPPLLPGPPYV